MLRFSFTARRSRALKLEVRREQARMLDPRSGFSEIFSEIEIRSDPLTGARTIINVSRTARPKQGLKAADAGAQQNQNCPFCPANIEGGTPKFPADLIPEGRVRFGKAVLFPNLFPLSELHGVCAFTPVHRLDIVELRAEELFDGMGCCQKFFGIGEKLGYPWHYLGWNHLPPAGASILHPHFQTISSKEPIKGPEVSARASADHFKRQGSSFWGELVDQERNSPRFIGDTEGFVWLAPWAPTGAYEIEAISLNKSSLLDLDEGELHGLADGLSKSLSSLWSLGITSVNMGVMSLPGPEADSYGAAGDEFYRVNLRIMGRPGGGLSDRALLELYGGEVAVSTLPEEYAKAFRSAFG
jgi:galactose-1-phosphate uridylyltransferase